MWKAIERCNTLEELATAIDTLLFWADLEDDETSIFLLLLPNTFKRVVAVMLAFKTGLKHTSMDGRKLCATCTETLLMKGSSM